MAESYSVKAILSATDNGFSSTLKNAMGAADSLGQKIKNGFNFGFLTGAGQAAFSAITSGVKDIIGDVDSANAAWKNFASNMSIIGKSTDEIESVKKELQSFAETTVYSSSDMASTYAQLAAVGTKNTTALVKGFGGLAAAAENPQQAMKTLSQQATQMAAKPSVAWADFKLMLEQTPAGIAAVAKEMGMSTSELVTAVQDGKVKTDRFFDAIQKVGTSDSFTKLATEYKTMDQAMDGLKETLANKLTPAWDVLSKAGISAITLVSDALDGFDAQAIADGVKSAVDYIGMFFSTAKKAFSGVRTEVESALKAVGDALGISNVEFSKTDALNAFAKVCEKVASSIKTVANFIEEHADTIAKVMPYVLGLVAAFAGFKVLNTVAPGLGSFVGGLALMAAQGIAGLIGKLFGLSGAQKKVGDTSKQSAKDMLAAGASFLMIGVGVLAIAAGFALMAQSAIALASAGWGAIAVMVGMVAALVGLGIGMVAVLKTLSTFGTNALMAGAAMLMMGGAVMLIGVGFGLMAQASIALADAGWGAIAVMVGMVAVIALLAVGAAALGTALTAGAVGFIAFGAAIALAGAGALLAAVALQIITATLPALITYGAQGAVAIAQLGVSLSVFAVGAALAGASALILGAGLLVVAAAVVVMAAGFVLLAAGALLTAGALAVLSLALPLVAQYGSESAVAIVELGASLVIFAAGAALAGAAALVLGAGMLTASVGILLCAAGIAVIAAGLVLIGANSLIAATSFAIMAKMLPLVTADALSNSIALGVLAGGLTVFGAAALVAGAGAITLGTGLLLAAAGGLALAVAIAAVGVAMIVLSASIALASASMLMLAMALPQLAAVSNEGSAALIQLGVALTVFGAGAIVAGTGAILLGTGIAVAAVAVAALAIAVLAMSVATLAASGAIAVLAAVLPKLSAVGAEGATALTLVGAALVIFGVEAAAAGVASLAASVGVAAFGAAMLVSAAATVVMAAAIKGVSSSMKTIASNAKRAESSLDSMQNSVDVVESGLSALGDKAKSAMSKLTSAFDNTAKKAKDAGNKVGTGFTDGMQIGLKQSPAVATSAVMVVNVALLAGRAGAYRAGAYISQGFAQGMTSQLSTIRRAAAQMAAAADQAVKAKAKIHSPSKVSTDDGEDYGQGYVNGILSKVKDAWKAAEKLVSFPNIATPELAFAYDGEMSSDYSYSSNHEYTIEVPLEMDGKVVAKATAKYTQEELTKNQTRESRKHGKR